jgi:hypothetical protein
VKWAHFPAGFFLLAVFAVAHLGCNTILGIDQATLDPSDAAGGGTCSLTAPDPCNQCIAARCCASYEPCIASEDCQKGLSEYNVCVGSKFTDDAGGTCDEAFASSPNTLRSDLATCAFLHGNTSSERGCSEACKDKPVGGDICSTYCSCLADTCSDKVLGGESSCLDLCGGFTEAQLACRPYHCGLAKNAKAEGSESLRQTHCGHAVGEALCP